MQTAFITGFWRLIVFIGGLALFAVLESWRPFRKRLENRRPHYLRNLALGIGNGLVLNVTVSSLVVAYYQMLQDHSIGCLNAFRAAARLNLILSLVVLDFATYYWHRRNHEWKFLWRFHRVHHSDRDLDVTSASRFHLGEVAISTAFKMAVGALLGPAPVALALHESLLVLAAQFHHANIKLPGQWDRLARAVLVTPDMHRVHHSDLTMETNSNYSNFLSVWDRIFSTYQKRWDQREMVIGLKEYPAIRETTLPKLLAMPFTRS
ncbi:MAG: sterol desaturase family protein [Elusimicrobia bacterium]|nr:sterol desaturase family protein [Elusimicrobiota bacterium]